MQGYEKGWYSLFTCKKLEIETIDSVDLVNALDTEVNNFFF